MDIDVTEPAPADSVIMRRRLLGIGLGGAVVSLLPLLSGRASATTPPTTPTAGTSTADTTAAATTTTSPPIQPTLDDASLLNFARSLEIAIRGLYDVALATDVFDADQRAVMATFREAHEAYSVALSALLGESTPQLGDPIGDDLRSKFSADLKTVLDGAYTAESTAVATHTEIIGELRGLEGASLLASILIVEAANGTVIADLNNITTLDELLVVPEADALTPLATGGTTP